MNSVSCLLSLHRGFLSAFLLAQVSQQVFVWSSTKQILSETFPRLWHLLVVIVFFFFNFFIFHQEVVYSDGQAVISGVSVCFQIPDHMLAKGATSGKFISLNLRF